MKRSEAIKRASTRVDDVQGSPVQSSAGVPCLNAYYDSASIVWVSRDERGRVVRRRTPACSSIFIKRDDAGADLLRMLRESRLVTAILDEGDLLRVQVADRFFAERLCAKLEELFVPTFEGTVSPIRCQAADDDIVIQRPRRVFLDLETDSRVPFSRKEEMRVLCWALVDEHGAEVSQALSADTDNAERELLASLWCALEHSDQVVAWNGDRFDFPVLKARCEKLGLAMDKRVLWLDHLELFKRMNTMAAESGEEKQSYALQAIATAVLGEGKDDFDASKTWQAWSTPACSGSDCRACVECLRRYCVKDTALLHRIEAATGYIELLQTLCEACFAFSDSRGINPTNQAENLLLRIARSRGHHFATRLIGGSGAELRYRGAYVMEPTRKGVLEGVHVCDFKSLYPSIILSWNISAETRALEAPRPVYLSQRRPARQPNECEAATGLRFRTDVEGILPHAVVEVLRLREQWNERKSKCVPGTAEWCDADRRSTAYKIAANSFYGVCGSPLSRFYDVGVAEAVTQCGVMLIEETIAFARSCGLEVVYGDTDSAFVMGCTGAEFERFVERCNVELFPRLLAARGCRLNHIRLVYEKEFRRIVFACAKRYAGSFAHYKGKAATSDSKPEVKGLEYKRGDSSRLARAMQAELVELIVMRGCALDDANACVERWRHRVLNAPLEVADVQVSKSLSKALKGYDRKVKKDGAESRLPPHVEVALVLRERGRDVGEGTRIAYYCADGSVKPKLYRPAEDWSGDCDRFEQWETFVWPPSKRFVEAAFPGHDWSIFDRVRPRRRFVARRPKIGSTDELFK